MPKRTETFDAWNPGLESQIPTRLLPFVTLYRSENAEIDYRTAKEASDFCGLSPQDMCVFKVRRLVLHELLIRVTADLYVADGPSYEELGLNLRGMVAQILENHIDPKIKELENQFETLQIEIDKQINTILERDIFARKDTVKNEKSSGFFARFRRKTPDRTEDVLPEIAAQSEWQSKISELDAGLERACYSSLKTVVGSMISQRGRLFADKELIRKFVRNIVCNTYGSQMVGHWIEPIIAEAVRIEGYRFLPYQTSPFFMNVKGASAAGKSTIRPLQRKLAEKLNIPWEDFALISPDYWRKFMLDYDSLGEDYKYAAMLTGQELEIIDKKLDRYMGQKAAMQQMPHLLIDRFRFDSFSPSPNQQAESTLISRFGDTVYLFFIITPPQETVTRAWKRGGDTGRYKAVDDLLYHNIEAYTGMPQLFFSWVNTTKQKIHFEFLDNSVPFGEIPRTVAFGWNDKITILDAECLRRINKYQNVNIEAKRPQDVLLKTQDAPEDFIQDCLVNISDVTICDSKTLKIKGQTSSGNWEYKDHTLFEKTKSEGKVAEIRAVDFEMEKKYTVGKWDAR